MSARWQRRVVTVIGGAGFGKSVLLRQAMAENLLAPRGVDALVTCVPSDGDPTGMLCRLLTALEAPGRRPQTCPSLAAVLMALDAHPAHHVCVLLDDVHHVLAGDEGARVVADLVRDAPASVHFVLAGRRRIRGLARLRVEGVVADVGEQTLAFAPSERAALAALHDVDADAAEAFGGWPAPTVLAVTSGMQAAREYVREAVLEQLDAAEQTVLALAAAIGCGDLDVVRHAIDDGADPEAVLARVPHATVDGRGAFAVHELWRAVLDDVLHQPALRPLIARAADALVERRRFDHAFRLCAERDDWTRAASVIKASSGRGHAAVAPAVMAGWFSLLPPGRRDQPDGLLVRGAIGRVTDPFGSATADLLERAMLGFRAAGDIAGELSAGAELVYVLRNQGRSAECIGFLTRANELEAAGHPEAAAPAAVGRGFLADCVGDDARMVAELAAVAPGSLDRDWQLVVTFRLMMGHLVLGNGAEMVAAATRCTELAGATKDRNASAMAEWFAGRPERALAELDTVMSDAQTSGVDGVVLGTFAASVLAMTGRVDEASAQLASAAGTASSTAAPMLRGALTWAGATVAVAAGDDCAARRLIDDALVSAALDDPIGWRMAARWFPLAYVLCPSVRAELDARALGPLHRRRLDVARAVVWAGEAPPCAPAPPSTDAALVATTVPLPWAMRLASALHARDLPSGREIVELLFELQGEAARYALREVATTAQKRTADGARKLLGTVPMRPRRAVRLDVLGPVDLVLGDGAPVDAHWARERVRHLLLHLAVNGGAQRAQLVDALWPHLDPAAGEKNLRVTLTYLNQVLEPQRQAGEASFFVRQAGATLTLAGAPHIELDAASFDALLDDAEDADRRGLPSAALERHREAIGLWRGPCLADVVYEEWAQPTCTALTARYVRSTVRAGELSLAAGDVGAARRYASRALTADEWCEPAHRVLVAAALADGNRSGARRALAACDAMLDDLGIDADPRTHALRDHLAA